MKSSVCYKAEMLCETISRLPHWRRSGGGTACKLGAHCSQFKSAAPASGCASNHHSQLVLGLLLLLLLRSPLLVVHLVLAALGRSGALVGDELEQILLLAGAPAKKGAEKGEARWLARPLLEARETGQSSTTSLFSASAARLQPRPAKRPGPPPRPTRRG